MLCRNFPVKIDRDLSVGRWLLFNLTIGITGAAVTAGATYLDLSYLLPSQQLFGQIIEAIRGIVETEQAESDRSLQNTVAIVGVGLGGAGVGISAAPYLFPQEPVQPLLPPFSTNHFHPITQSVLLSLGFGVGFAAVTWIVIYLMQKR